MKKMKLNAEGHAGLEREIDSHLGRWDYDPWHYDGFGMFEEEFDDIEFGPIKIGRREYEFIVSGSYEVEVTDDSFSHEFGIEEGRSAHFSKVTAIYEVKAYDAYGDEWEVEYDEDTLLGRKRKQ